MARTLDPAQRTFPPSVLPPIKEAQFQRQVIGLAQYSGWRVAHFMPALNRKGQWRTAVQGDGKGFPDLVLVRERLVVAELKTDRGRLTPEQSIWIAKLRDAGVETHLWRPRDWEEIEQLLARPS